MANQDFILQSEYQRFQGRGFPGQVVSMHNVTSMLDAVCDKADGLSYGTIVAQGSTNDGVSPRVSAGGSNIKDLFGVVPRLIEHAPTELGGDSNVPFGKQFNVLRKGIMLITIPSGGNRGDDLKVNSTTGVIDVGAAGSGELSLTGKAQLMETVTAGDLARVEFNFGV